MELVSSSITRRQFVVGASVAGAGLLAGCGRLPWQAQQSVHRIGYLIPAGAAARQNFLQGLHDHGYVEGQNVFIEARDAEGHLERLPALAADLVTRQVDVIVTLGGPATTAA